VIDYIFLALKGLRPLVKCHYLSRIIVKLQVFLYNIEILKINMPKRILLLLLLVLNLLVLPASLGFDVAHAQFLPLDPKLYDTGFVTPEGKTSLQQATNLVGRIANAARLILGSIAVLMAIVAAIGMVTARGSEEGYEKNKKALLYAVIGLFIVALSGDLARIVDLSGGGLLGGRKEILERVRIFDDSVRIIITFIKYLIGAVAVLMMIRSGLRLATVGGSEEEATKDKKNLFYIGIGLVALIFVDSLISRVFYKIDNPFENPTLDVAQGIREITGFTNLVISFVGPIAVLSLIAAGVMYAVSAGNEELQTKARKMIIVSLIGIIVIYGAFGIVTTFIIGQF